LLHPLLLRARARARFYAPADAAAPCCLRTGVRCCWCVCCYHRCSCHTTASATGCLYLRFVLRVHCTTPHTILTVSLLAGWNLLDLGYGFPYGSRRRIASLLFVITGWTHVGLRYLFSPLRMVR
jgi:hypothetical protein